MHNLQQPDESLKCAVNLMQISCSTWKFNLLRKLTPQRKIGLDTPLEKEWIPAMPANQNSLQADGMNQWNLNAYQIVYNTVEIILRVIVQSNFGKVNAISTNDVHSESTFVRRSFTVQMTHTWAHNHLKSTATHPCLEIISYPYGHHGSIVKAYKYSFATGTV